MDRHTGTVGDSCPSTGAIPDLEAMAQALETLDQAHLLWLLRDAVPEQHAFIMTKVTMDAIAAQRERLLSSTDIVQRARLTGAERTTLQALDTAFVVVEDAQLLTEAPLLAFARAWIWQHPEALWCWPEYALLLDPALGGKRDAALQLAAWLGAELQCS